MRNLLKPTHSSHDQPDNMSSDQQHRWFITDDAPNKIDNYNFSRKPLIPLPGFQTASTVAWDKQRQRCWMLLRDATVVRLKSPSSFLQPHV